MPIENGSFTVRRRADASTAKARRKGFPQRAVPAESRVLLEAGDVPDPPPWKLRGIAGWDEPPQDSSFTLEDEQLAADVDAMTTSLCVANPGSEPPQIAMATNALSELAGVEEADLLGKSPAVLQSEGASAAAKAEFAAGLVERRFASVRTTVAQKDRGTLLSQLTVMPVHNTSGSTIALLCAVYDVSNESRLQGGGLGASGEQLGAERCKELYRHYVAPCMLVSTGSWDCPVGEVTPGFEALTGYRDADIRGASCFCLAGPDTDTAVLKQMLLNLRNGAAGRYRLLLYRKGGAPFWALVMNLPLPWMAGSGPSEEAAGFEGQDSSSRRLLAQSSVPAPKGSSSSQLVVVVDVTCSRLKRLGKYMLGKVIGRGASGVVRVCKDMDTGERIAIKTVDPSRFRSINEIEQIQEEIQVLSKLSHPHIITLQDVQFVNNKFHFLMELAGGGQLTNYIYSHDGHRLPEAEARRLFLQMVAALDYCHRRRIIHRDLKPENMLLDEHRNIKIADFGLAGINSPFSTNMTASVGTPEFVAPEVFSGRSYNGPAVDIWSLGVILYEAVQGRLPFEGKSDKELFKLVSKGEYEPLQGDLSAQLAELVSCMLTVDPAQRIGLDAIRSHAWCRLHSSASGTGDDSHDHDLPGGPSGRDGEDDAPEFQYAPEEMHESVRIQIPADLLGAASADDPFSMAMKRGMAGVLSAGPSNLSSPTGAADACCRKNSQLSDTSCSGLLEPGLISRSSSLDDKLDGHDMRLHVESSAASCTAALASPGGRFSSKVASSSGLGSADDVGDSGFCRGATCIARSDAAGCLRPGSKRPGSLQPSAASSLCPPPGQPGKPARMPSLLPPLSTVDGSIRRRQGNEGALGGGPDTSQASSPTGQHRRIASDISNGYENTRMRVTDDHGGNAVVGSPSKAGSLAVSVTKARRQKLAPGHLPPISDPKQRRPL